MHFLNENPSRVELYESFFHRSLIICEINSFLSNYSLEAFRRVYVIIKISRTFLLSPAIYYFLFQRAVFKRNSFTNRSFRVFEFVETLSGHVSRKFITSINIFSHTFLFIAIVVFGYWMRNKLFSLKKSVAINIIQFGV